MKITGKNVPSWALAKFKEIMSDMAIDGSGDGTSKTRRKVGLVKTTKKKNPRKYDYEEAVDALIAYLKKKGVKKEWTSFRWLQIQALKEGIFNTDYWVKCTQETSDILIAYPTVSDFEGVRDYAYPDAANQPTKCTYGNGSPETGMPECAGTTKSGFFSDDYLKWARTVITLKNKCTKGDKEPLFLKLTCTLVVDGDARACRAFLSLIIRRWLCAAGSTRLTTLENPTDKPIYAWYRYRLPEWVGGSFVTAETKRLVYTARGPDYEEAGVELKKLVVLGAPMPMMGYRYNNNTDTMTSLYDYNLEAWQINKAKAWTHHTISGNSYERPFAICAADFGAGSKLFVAMTPHTSLTDVNFITSTDGLSWEGQSLVFANNGPTQDYDSNYLDQSAIAFKGTAYIAGYFASDGTPIIFTTSDGTTFSAVDIWNDETTITRGFAIAGNRLLAYGNSDGAGPMLTYTDDGASWATPYAAPSMSVIPHYVILISGEDHFILGHTTAASAGQICHSTDGVTWTTKNLEVTAARVSYVIKADRYYLVGQRGSFYGYWATSDWVTFDAFVSADIRASKKVGDIWLTLTSSTTGAPREMTNINDYTTSDGWGAVSCTYLQIATDGDTTILIDNVANVMHTLS